jgi:hypothetical protein
MSWVKPVRRRLQTCPAEFNLVPQKQYNSMNHEIVTRKVRLEQEAASLLYFLALKKAST